VASIVLGWTEINSYRASIGPGIGRPPRPAACEFCDGVRVWFDGWRVAFCVVLADGRPHRFDEGLPIKRVKCARCGTSWPLRPAFLYPHRSFEPDFVEAAVLAYLADEHATYAGVAKQFGCSPRALWEWVGWLGRLLLPAALIAELSRIDSRGRAAELMPRAVSQDHPKAYSSTRAVLLLNALQLLAAAGLYAHVQPHPPDDPSPLRFWLMARFLAFRAIALVSRPGFSPPLPVKRRGPAG
jgi:transposase-like protein